MWNIECLRDEIKALKRWHGKGNDTKNQTQSDF